MEMASGLFGQNIIPSGSKIANFLHIIAATALLVKDADKLTFRKNLALTTLHVIEGVLKELPERWLCNT